MRFCLLGFLIMNISLAGAATVIRDKKKMEIPSDYKLQAGDEIHSGKTKVKLALHPGSEIVLKANSKILVSHHQLTTTDTKGKAIIDIDLLKGSLKYKIQNSGNQETEFRINTPGASFASTEADAEITLERSKSSSVKVTHGQVLVSSPYIQSFAPEVVKADEKLRFDMKRRAFVK